MRNTLAYFGTNSQPQISNLYQFPTNFAITFKINFTALEDTSTVHFVIGTSLDTSSEEVYISSGIRNNTNTIDICGSGDAKISIPKSIFPLNKWVDVIMFVKDGTVAAKVLQDINTPLFNSSAAYTLSSTGSYPFVISNTSSSKIKFYIDDLRIWDTTNLTFLQVEKYDQIYNLTLDSTESAKLLHRIITKNGTLQCVGATQENITYVSSSYKPTYVNMDMYPYSDRNVIIKDNGKYYSFKSDNYDQTSQMYNEITDLDANNFDDYAEGSPALCESVTIGTETFRPIDKFTDPHIIIQDNKKVKVKGTMKDAGMAVLLTPISFKRFSKIKELAATKTLSTTSQIKLVFSFDNGISWQTYNLIDKWKQINVDIPLKAFDKLNTAEKQLWDDAKAEILSNGIDINNINVIENITTSMMIAVVTKIASYSDTVTLNNIQVTYDGNKILTKLSTSECGIQIEGDNINLTPQVTCDTLMMSMVTNL